MRKVVFIILSVVVIGIIVFFGWREFHVPGINYVADKVGLSVENYLIVQRLYAADVDYEAFEAKLDELLIYAEFDEEERFQAALAAGRPVFFPSFNIHVSTVPNEDGEDRIRVNGHVALGIAERQTEGRFRIGEMSVEAIAQSGLAIDDVEVAVRPEHDDEVLTLIFNDTNAAFDMSNATSFSVFMTGDTGMLTLQFKYAVDVQTPLVLTALEEQVLQLHVMITRNDFGVITSEFRVEPYHNLEQLLEE